jgi:XTP/dITP diphosphohydrolase
MPALVVATRNTGKLREIQALLAGLPVEVLPLPPDASEVAETAATFAGNAEIKARAAFEQSKIDAWVLADDSGLEVDALTGAPGVHSARYAGPNATDADNVTKLLAALRGVPDEARTARFRCVLALLAPDGRLWSVDGTCEGRIAHAPRGEHGFGYDPVFLLPELGRTMAELPPEQKNRISHRARALAKARDLLQRLL